LRVAGYEWYTDLRDEHGFIAKGGFPEKRSALTAKARRTPRFGLDNALDAMLENGCVLQKSWTEQSMYLDRSADHVTRQSIKFFARLRSPI